MSRAAVRHYFVFLAALAPLAGCELVPRREPSASRFAEQRAGTEIPVASQSGAANPEPGPAVTATVTPAPAEPAAVNPGTGTPARRSFALQITPNRLHTPSAPAPAPPAPEKQLPPPDGWKAHTVTPTAHTQTMPSRANEAMPPRGPVSRADGPALPGPSPAGVLPAPAPVPPVSTPVPPAPVAGAVVTGGPAVPGGPEAHQRVAPTALGSVMQMPPGESPVERALELSKRLDLLTAEKAALLRKVRDLEEAILARDQRLNEITRQVNEATSDVARARRDLASWAEELKSQQARLRQQDRENQELLRSIIAMMEKMLNPDMPGSPLPRPSGGS